MKVPQYKSYATSLAAVEMVQLIPLPVQLQTASTCGSLATN